jgi:hypothetical protein
MIDKIDDRSEDEVLGADVSDEALEAAAFDERLAAYTQMGLCTFSSCPL